MDKNLGLVLEGGAMRGMFTAGVIDVFMKNQITFDKAVGVSAGSVFGCNLKSLQPGRVIRYNKKYCHDWRYCSLRSLIKTGDLYGSEFCYYTLPGKLDPFDFETYKKNPMEFFVTVTDVESGKAVYHKLDSCDGHEIEWMRASASMPLASKPVKIEGKRFLDGGISDSIPLEFMESQGCRKNVVVLTQERGFVKKPNGLIPLMKFALRKEQALLEALKKRHIMYNRELELVFNREKEGKAFIICPPESLNIKRTEHNPDELERVYEVGVKTAEKSLEDLKKFIDSKS